jgi:hypothetical protein
LMSAKPGEDGMMKKFRSQSRGMQIDFNPNQAPSARVSGPTRMRPVETASGDDANLQGVTDLQQKLQDLPLSRPEKVAAAAQRLSNVQYPPDELLNRIAQLLAIRLGQ